MATQGGNTRCSKRAGLCHLPGNYERTDPLAYESTGAPCKTHPTYACRKRNARGTTDDLYASESLVSRWQLAVATRSPPRVSETPSCRSARKTEPETRNNAKQAAWPKRRDLALICNIQLYRCDECTNPEMICTRVRIQLESHIKRNHPLVIPNSYPKVAPKCS